MRLLLDTHAFVWWIAGSHALSRVARDAIRDDGNEIVLSVASAWEIATRHRSGKLPRVGALAADVERSIVDQGFPTLPVNVRQAQVAGTLPGPHRDPFDRMLIAPRCWRIRC